MEVMAPLPKVKKTSLKSKTQNIIFASSAENLALVEKLIDDVCSKYEVDENHYGNILIAVTEAVNNAIFHGNRSNPDKKVKVTFLPDEERLFFVIEDEGKGFDYNTLPDPTSPENLEKPFGRGIFLMKNLSDEVRFSNNGRTVEMSFFVGKN